MTAVEAHIDDPDFETDHLARESGISRRQLNRKLRALTGQSVREFIRIMRLKRAAQLLQQQSGTVTEIAYEVGFNNIGHFAKIFREQFGVSPSEYLKKNSGQKT
jgi:transcriptional regulator GlxA family with amidase domain